ncbi:MAG TPA: TonB-dependent receptor [Longimicrobium sp.]|nr:TonB-dependent receptor [Longimicrobium sp.]
MLKRCVWAVISLLLASPLAAQVTGTVAGRVTDGSNQRPLAGVQVSVSGSARSAVTNADGDYRLTVGVGAVTIRANTLGYTAVSTTVNVAAGETITHNLALTPSPIALDAMVVSASRRAERAQEAPASVSVVGAQEVAQRPAVNAAEHLRNVPGVDIAQNGIFNTNVVVRGFNAAFSSSLAMLTDYRIASVPGLQVNRMGSIALTNEDLERIETVLGPGAALYGPNTANGIVHLLTRSPLDDPGTVVSLAGGTREAVMGSFRTAHAVTPTLGFKLSGSYLRANEWEFNDTTEARLRTAAEGTLTAFRTAQTALGRTEAQIADSIRRNPTLFALTRVGLRTDEARRWGVDGRLDWRPRDGLSAVLQAGRTSNTSVDLTGISASVQDDYLITYYQARFSAGRLFAQGYVEEGDAGGTYTARTGEEVIDRSKLSVAQLQHGFDLLGGRQSFTYGADFLFTQPESGGTIYGRNEEDDEYTQWGAYLQSETRILPRLNLVLAGRLDHHSVLDNQIFSPRAGLVFTPSDGQTLRATYNRAFQAPTAVNFFLDRLSSRSGPYAVRAIGPGVKGFNFHMDNGSVGIRSPFNPAGAGGANTRVAYTSQAVSRYAINFLVATGRITPAEAGALLAANPNFTVIGRNPQTGVLGAFDPATVQDLEGLKEERSEVFEVGYRGIVAQRFLLTADVWHMKRNNFISQLFAPAPMLLVSGQQVAQFLAANGIAPDRAATLATAVATTPLAMVSAAEGDLYTDGVPILITYKNYGEVDLTGVDLSAQALLGDFRVGGTASFVSDNYFTFAGEQPVALNAPKEKGAFWLGYQGARSGFSGEARVRYTGGFPVYSGVYVGTTCADNAGVGDCVDSATLFDLTLGYRVPRMRGTSLQLSATNLFDERHQSFVGVPAIGRMVLLRVTQEF